MKLNAKQKEIAHYYILAFILLMAYYFAELIGLVPWIFNQNIIVLLIVLTGYYGTVIMFADRLLHSLLKLK